MTRSRRTWWVLFLLLYGLQQGLLWWLYWSPTAKTLFGDEVLYVARARGIAGLADMPPKEWLWPPLYHWFLGALFRVFGQNFVVVQIAQNLLLLLCAGFLRGLWLTLDSRRRAANLAAAVFLLNPSTLAFAWWMWPECLHLCLLLGALWLLVCVRSSRWVQFTAGVAVGLAILSKSLLAPFWPFFALLWWRRSPPQAGTDARGRIRTLIEWMRGGGRPAVLRSVFFLAGLGLVTAPMLYYGWRLTGTPMIADSSGFNLEGGLSDRWRSDYIDDAVAPLYGHYLSLPGTPQQRNAVMLQEAADLVRRQGLWDTLRHQMGQQYFRLFSAKTTLVTQLAGPACAGRTGAYATPPGALTRGLEGDADAWHVLTLVAFAFGLAGWRRWREPLVWWLALFFAYQFALFLPLHVKARFLLPLMPFLCGFAASAVSALGGKSDALTFTPRRIALGAALAALLLFLAFGGPWLDNSCG
jgi:hypothetical protein